MLENPWVIVLITVAALVALRLLLLLVLSGGSVERIKLAVRTSFRTLRNPVFAEKARALLEPPPPPPPPKPSGAPLRLLALLQREGRLIDFLLEDLTQADGEQVVAAVRDIQPKCQRALKEHLALEPVLPQREGDSVEVPPGFDPSAIRLTGNVTGQPPFRGTLLHQGWRVQEIKLAPPPEGQDEFVLQPAEVDLP
jgi:hypothetical protein